MKKMAKMMVTLTVALLVLTGCSGKTSYELTITDPGVYSVVSQSGLDSFGWQEREEKDGNTSGMFTIKKDGEYEIVVKDTAGEQYTITVTRNGGKAEAKADGISVEMKKK